MEAHKQTGVKMWFQIVKAKLRPSAYNSPLLVIQRPCARREDYSGFSPLSLLGLCLLLEHLITHQHLHQNVQREKEEEGQVHCNVQ